MRVGFVRARGLAALARVGSVLLPGREIRVCASQSIRERERHKESMEKQSERARERWRVCMREI